MVRSSVTTCHTLCPPPGVRLGARAVHQDARVTRADAVIPRFCNWRVFVWHRGHTNIFGEISVQKYREFSPGQEERFGRDLGRWNMCLEKICFKLMFDWCWRLKIGLSFLPAVSCGVWKMIWSTDPLILFWQLPIMSRFFRNISGSGPGLWWGQYYYLHLNQSPVAGPRFEHLELCCH